MGEFSVELLVPNRIKWKWVGISERGLTTDNPATFDNIEQAETLLSHAVRGTIYHYPEYDEFGHKTK